MHVFKDYYHNTVKLSFEEQPFQVILSMFGLFAAIKENGYLQNMRIEATSFQEGK